MMNFSKCQSPMHAALQSSKRPEKATLHSNMREKSRDCHQ